MLLFAASTPTPTRVLFGISIALCVPFMPFILVTIWTRRRWKNWYYQPSTVRQFYASQAKAHKINVKRKRVQFCPANPANCNRDEEIMSRRRQQIEEILRTDQENHLKIQV